MRVTDSLAQPSTFCPARDAECVRHHAPSPTTALLYDAFKKRGERCEPARRQVHKSGICVFRLVLGPCGISAYHLRIGQPGSGNASKGSRGKLRIVFDAQDAGL